MSSTAEFQNELLRKISESAGLSYKEFVAEIPSPSFSLAITAAHIHDARAKEQREKFQPFIRMMTTSVIAHAAGERRPHTSDMMTMIDDINRVEMTPITEMVDRLLNVKIRISQNFKRDFDRMRTECLI